MDEKLKKEAVSTTFSDAVQQVKYSVDYGNEFWF